MVLGTMEMVHLIGAILPSTPLLGETATQCDSVNDGDDGYGRKEVSIGL